MTCSNNSIGLFRSTTERDEMRDDVLIGYSGYLGSSLLRQRPFDVQVRRADLDTLRGGRFGTVVCAGAPGQKWLANKEPEADWSNLQRLMDVLSTVRCERMILLSTVDVYPDADGADERTSVPEGASAYGVHRLELERFVQQHFEDPLVVRLPGLVGPGLRKNVVFDLLHRNNLAAVDFRSVYQFYPVVNLWCDLSKLLRTGVQLAHLSAEPLSVTEVAAEGFGRSFSNILTSLPVRYDLQSTLGSLWGTSSPYLYSKAESLLAIRAYAQSDGSAGNPFIRQEAYSA
ncbi:NAD-dependent epimerase/dehydratase family protein [Deinococcus sp. UYEF24]